MRGRLNLLKGSDEVWDDGRLNREGPGGSATPTFPPRGFMIGAKRGRNTARLFG
jgi:hypothetical protein